MEDHLYNELLPFWITRCWDEKWGGYLTQWDAKGEDSRLDEKSLVAHMRTIYSLSLAASYGHDRDGQCRILAEKGVRFAIDRYWDPLYGGFYWLFNRKNEVVIDKKIAYGLSFAINALSTYTIAFGDPIGLAYARKCFDLLQIYAAETSYGGYWEMFERDWELCSGGSGGGDRKTFDVHMHIMLSFTALYACSGEDIHRRKLEEIVLLITSNMLHPSYGTGVPQFFGNWSVAPQIKFDIVWGCDRFGNGNRVKHDDNISYAHNVELFWFLNATLKVLQIQSEEYSPVLDKLLKNATTHGVDHAYGGVFVEGSFDGKRVYDDRKEFWQQAEFLIGMLDAYLMHKDDKYLKLYQNVHRFVFDKVINHEVGEWLALLSRDGQPLWNYMSNSWKVNYHTIRAVVLCIDRLEMIVENM